jgi:hypothetical protein
MYVISKLIAYAAFMSTDYKADPAQKYGVIIRLGMQYKQISPS